MNPDTDPGAKTRKKKQTKRYVVTKNGIDCCYKHGGCFSLKLGVLCPCLPGERAQIFGGESSANKAIARTVTIRNRMNGSLLDDWEKFRDLMEPGAFEVVYLKPTG